MLPKSVVQLCSRLPGGIEGAIHTMENIYQENCSQNNDWGLLLVDANNPFNSLNRISALLEARVHWHRCQDSYTTLIVEMLN
jgi:hypothetical protein